MPLPLAILVGLVLGMTLAWVARAELARSEVPLLLARPFVIALGLGAIVFVALHGDWAYLYLIRSSHIPSAVDLLLVVVAALQVPLGFAIATPWAIAKRGTRVLQVNAVIGAAVVILCAVFARRLSVSASFTQYHGGFGAVPIGRSPLGRGVLLSWIALALAYAWSFHALRSSRRV